MIPFHLGELRELVNGTLVKGSDTLLLKNASLYLEIVDSINTVLFLRSSWKANWNIIRKNVPCAVITNEDIEELRNIEGCSIIKVDDVKTAYWKFVEYYRNRFQIPVVAVTGTCGKTTTKDMIKHILKHSCKVTGTEYSANGCTGHLVYLLRMDNSTQAAVYETAVGSPGDITYSCRHFKPMIGVITTIGIDHLDKCKTEEGYIQAKAEIVTAVGNEGIMIINSDDPNSKKIGLENFRGRIITFGIHNPSDFQASEVMYAKNGMEFVLTLHLMKYHMFVPGYGMHQVYNALAALAAVHELGIGMNEAAERLSTFENLRAHLQLVNGVDGCLILDDTWNTNPTSLKAAFNTLCCIANGKKKVALIGHIGALGDNSTEISLKVGDMIAETCVDLLITVGETAELIASQARERGLKGEIHAFRDINGAADILKNALDQNTILLAKCSMFDYPFKDLLKSLKV